MNFESIVNDFGLLVDSKKGIQRVRELVRDLAIRGILIENPNKSISSSEGSQPLLPSSWRWVKIEEVADFVNGFAFRSDEYISNGVGVVRMSDMKNGEISPEGMKFVSADRLKSLDINFQVKPNDIVMGMTGATLGKPCVNRTSEIFLLNQRIGKFVPKEIDPDYLLLCLANLENSFMSLSFGTGVNNLSTRQIKDSLIPLPPRGMQIEIVKVVGEMYKICDKLETSLNSKRDLASLARKSAISAISIAHSGDDLDLAWDRIQSNWKVMAGTPEAIGLIKTLILDLAVRGDLVTVNHPNEMETIEWTTSELKLDDSRLWHLPTLRKEKRNGWHRIPLAKVGSWGSGGTPTSSRKDFYQDGTIPWAVIGDLNNEIMTSTEASITEKALAESSSRLVPKGAILIAMYGASIGKTAITGIECCTNQAIAHCIVDTKLVSKDYFFIVAKSLKRHLIQEGKGAAQPNISQSVLKHLIIDLPPLAEQALIVARVEALMQLCDRLNLSLRESELLAEKFSRSVVSASA